MSAKNLNSEKKPTKDSISCLEKIVKKKFTYQEDSHKCITTNVTFVNNQEENYLKKIESENDEDQIESEIMMSFIDNADVTECDIDENTNLCKKFNIPNVNETESESECANKSKKIESNKIQSDDSHEKNKINSKQTESEDLNETESENSNKYRIIYPKKPSKDNKKNFLINKFRKVKRIETRNKGARKDSLRKICKTNHLHCIRSLIIEIMSKKYDKKEIKIGKFSNGSDISINTIKKLYKKKMKQFIVENKKIFLKNENLFNSFINDNFFLENFAKLSIFKFLEKSYFHENTNFIDGYKIYQNFITDKELLKNINLKFIDHFRNKVPNKTRKIKLFIIHKE